MLKDIKGNLIISCQALPSEPLHSSFIMGRMALAAFQSGAKGIRANTVKDIIEIKKNTKLPIIGIIKKDYKDSKVFITPTIIEIKELIEVGVDVIAIDATNRKRPNNETLEDIINYVRDNSKVKLMADCQNIIDAYRAEKLGFDFIGTTLFGISTKTNEGVIFDDDCKIIKEILNNIKTPLIVEGHIDTPKLARKIQDLKPYSMVIGSSITRPQFIAKKFVDAIKEEKNEK